MAVTTTSLQLLDLTWHFDELADLGEFFAALPVPDRPGTG